MRWRAAGSGASTRRCGAWTRLGGVGVLGFFFAIWSRHSSGNSHVAAEECRDGGWIFGDRAARQRSEERAPVRPRAKARIEDRDNSAIGVAADEPAESLAQLQQRGGKRVVAEP